MRFARASPWKCSTASDPCPCRSRYQDIQRLRDERLTRYQRVLHSQPSNPDDASQSDASVSVSDFDDDQLEAMAPRTIQLTQAELGQSSTADEGEFDLDPRGAEEGFAPDSHFDPGFELFDLSSDRLPSDFRLDPDSLEALMTSVCAAGC